MKYVSIDIETTGLDPETCNTIEFAAVIDDLQDQKPLEKLPKFQTYVSHKVYTGEAYALGMHGELFKKLASYKKNPDIRICYPEKLFQAFYTFLTNNGFRPENPHVNRVSINPAGKNFAAFDKRFLDKLPNEFVTFRHRSLDPAILYMDPYDDKMPDMAECLKRAGMSDEVSHNALDDAMVVVKLLRKRFPDGISAATLGK